ncbi:MAG: hypothetical protein ACPLIG_02640 [Candidatus Bathyarchaeales archaeon]
MRCARLTLILVLISLVCISCFRNSVDYNIAPSVSALESNELTASLFWSNSLLYQGDMATVRISLKSSSTDQLFIYYIGIHFDWMPEGGFYGYDLSDNPVLIPSGGNYIFDPISIQIPINTTAGEHSYFVGIEGRQGSTTAFSWDSPPSTVQIHPFGYAIMLTQIERELNESIHANYESAEARSLVQQAQSEFAKAQPLALEGKWQEALPHLYNASDLLTRAGEIEQLNAEQQASQQTLLLYGAIIAVVAVVVAAVIVGVVRKKRKRLISATAQQSETAEESTAKQT